MVQYLFWGRQVFSFLTWKCMFRWLRYFWIAAKPGIKVTSYVLQFIYYRHIVHIFFPYVFGIKMLWNNFPGVIIIIQFVSRGQTSTNIRKWKLGFKGKLGRFQFWSWILGSAQLQTFFSCLAFCSDMNGCYLCVCVCVCPWFEFSFFYLFFFKIMIGDESCQIKHTWESLWAMQSILLSYWLRVLLITIILCIFWG